MTEGTKMANNSYDKSGPEKNLWSAESWQDVAPEDKDVLDEDAFSFRPHAAVNAESDDPGHWEPGSRNALWGFDALWKPEIWRSSKISKALGMRIRQPTFSNHETISLCARRLT